jgi:hypothetical protein
MARAQGGAYPKESPFKPQALLLVSLVDKTHNAEAILFGHRELGSALFDRVDGKADGTRWYYDELASCFARVMPGRLSGQLSNELLAKLSYWTRHAHWQPDEARGGSSRHCQTMPQVVVARRAAARGSNTQLDLCAF